MRKTAVAARPTAISKAMKKLEKADRLEWEICRLIAEAAEIDGIEKPEILPAMDSMGQVRRALYATYDVVRELNKAVQSRDEARRRDKYWKPCSSSRADG
jgi:hypothetical protein